ncbi:hypothetical protein ACFSL4_00140 [Streptomyces caeni]|uniref:Uncharacterized protein n=1 Tax=Streptomyces caeni TaxID=2307231 RepID=A0ABW4IH87_9ACTN
MGDPLVWRRGDGPVAAWLERTADLLVGPQPDGHEVRGDIHWPDQPYGRITHQGLGLPDLAEVLTAARID